MFFEILKWKVKNWKFLIELVNIILVRVVWWYIYLKSVCDIMYVFFFFLCVMLYILIEEK